MARNFGSILGSSRFEDFLARMTGGSSDHDHMNGTTGNNILYGGASADTVAGMAGNDRLDGGSGDDKVWGGSGNDQLGGGAGADILVGGFGADRMDGGNGNDVLLSRSDAGEMVAAQDGTTLLFAAESAAFTAVNDTLVGGRGADTFRFEGLINANDEIIAKHVNADGTIDWAGVTGENDNVHDHWLDGFGNDVIRDFNRCPGRQDRNRGAHQRGAIDRAPRQQRRRPRRLQRHHRHQPTGRCRRARRRPAWHDYRLR